MVGSFFRLGMSFSMYRESNFFPYAEHGWRSGKSSFLKSCGDVFTPGLFLPFPLSPEVPGNNGSPPKIPVFSTRFLSGKILVITGITIRENGDPGAGARFEMTVLKKGAW